MHEFALGRKTPTPTLFCPGNYSNQELRKMACRSHLIWNLAIKKTLKRSLCQLQPHSKRWRHSISTTVYWRSFPWIWAGPPHICLTNIKSNKDHFVEAYINLGWQNLNIIIKLILNFCGNYASNYKFRLSYKKNLSLYIYWLRYTA